MAGLKAALDALPSPDAAVLEHAARWVGARFEEEKRHRAEMGFDDMLLRLDTALQADGGERLATLIREQFPVALIDEFQDADPVQYRIFETIYRISNSPETGLFLIGDPAGDPCVSRCRHLHLPARPSCHSRPTAHTGHQLSLQPRDGGCGEPRVCRAEQRDTDARCVFVP